MNKKISEKNVLLPDRNRMDFEILDSGGFRKLERYGDTILIRPEPRASWMPLLPPESWDAAGAEYVEAENAWKMHQPVKAWTIECHDIRIGLEIAQSPQIGIFPEHEPYWGWISELVRQNASAEQPLRVLNLFGYTGLASLFAAHAGAQVTHVDSSKRALRMGKVNMQLSGLKQLPVRWILDDAVRFVEKEIRRGNTYQGVIFDPPQFGRGPKREQWKFADNYPELCALLGQVITPDPVFIALTAYELDSQPEAFLTDFGRIIELNTGSLETGYLGLRDMSGGRVLKMSQFIRWSKV